MNKLQSLLAVFILLFAAGVRAAEWTGTLHWLQRVELSTPVSGVISKVAVDAGDLVKQGQVLLQLDDRGFSSLVKKAEAQVASHRETLAEAKRELERVVEMYERTLLAEHELQLARIAVSQAQADLVAAETAQTLARLNLEYSQLKAPFAGVILQRQAEVGMTVVTRWQSFPLMVLAETGRMLARIEVADQELATLRIGMDAQVRIQDKVFQGKLQRIGMEPIATGGGKPHYAVDVVFSYPVNMQLRAGLSAVVVVP